jgi:hypothetical protein
MATRWLGLMTAVLVANGAMPALARQIMVSAEDGKPVRPGETLATTTPDLLRVLTITPAGPRTIATVAVPASMTGPPESVKLTHDGRYAVVSAAQALDPAATPPLAPGDAVSLVDLTTPARPRLIETVHAGAGASGVAIAPRGDLVLVANARADSVSAFTLARGHLIPRATFALPAGSRPVSARILPGGRSAIVVCGTGRIFRLAIAARSIALAPEAGAIGTGASGIALSPDGRTAYVAGSEPSPAGGGTFVVAIDSATLRVVAKVPLPPSAEGLALSPSGRWLEVTLLDGTNLPPGDPKHHDAGTMAVLSINATALDLVAQTATGRLCQGAAWSDDERSIVLQCAEDRRIETYRFDHGSTLQRLGTTIATVGRPGAMASVGYR